VAKPRPLQNVFGLGMKRDFPRNQMPPATVWNAVDLILNYGAPLRQRGGWAHYSSDISAITAASATYIKGGIYASFAASGGATEKNLCVDEDGKIFSVTSGGASLIGTGVTLLQNPVFHGGAAASAATAVFTGLALFPDGTGAAVPKKYDGTTLSDLNGTPPKARYACVYKDFTVLANGTVGSTYYPNRIWFSPAGDPDCATSGAVTAWDTDNAWIDFSQEVKGLVGLKNAMLVFHEDQISRVRGSSPPPDEDMVVDDPVFQIGLLDAFSIATHNDTAIWASTEGIIRSDGVTPENLTLKCGMLQYWLSLMQDYTSTWTIAGGVIRDFYVCVIMDGTTFKDAFLINLTNYSLVRLSNVDATSFWGGALSGFEELFWGRRGAARVSSFASVFNKVGDSSYASDGDGDAVAPVLETPYYMIGSFGLKRIRRAYFDYELTDHGSSNPTVTASYILTPEETSYTAISTTLDETADMRRKRRDVNERAHGIAFKFTRANAGDLLFYGVEAEMEALEGSRLQQ